MIISLRVSITNIVKYMKSVSGAELKEKFEFINKVIYVRGAI